MYVENFFHLDYTTQQELHSRVPVFGYGLFGQVIYSDHYSRKINGVKEQWADTVIRVIEGVFSIRKDYYIKNRIIWNECNMQYLAGNMARGLFELKWCPSGRGLWAMGTELMYTRGAMFLYNCALTKIDGVEDFCWFMDGLMCAAGVTGVIGEPIRLNKGEGSFDHSVSDSREGWVHSVRLLLNHYLNGKPYPIFNYSLIREKGTPLKLFGGTASGPAPLDNLHSNIDYVASLYAEGYIDSTRFTADICNLIGCCVVAGNVRRSAEMLISSPNSSFRDLKNYYINPYREPWGWMSNNTEALNSSEDFENIKLNVDGELVGYLNKQNLQHGRLRLNETFIPDQAIGVNPCGEIPLENKEVCNVCETFPTRCSNTNDWLVQCGHAAFYTTTVALLPTHQPSTNFMIRKNRRIGVGLVNYVGWVARHGTAKIIKAMREGYGIIRQVNKFYSIEAGVPESLRVTTIKPGGTVPKLAGCNPAIGYPNGEYIIRRKRVSMDSDLCSLLKQANVPWEVDHYSDNTLCFEFPIYTGHRSVKPSLWQQAMNLVTVQREWSDNAVSNTLWYDTEEELLDVAASIMPMIKSISFVQRDCGKYKQMPEEEISASEYYKRTSDIGAVDLMQLSNDGIGESYCTGETCEVSK